MTKDGRFDIFLPAPPGLEDTLLAEVRTKGFNSPRAVPGGVVLRGGWPDVWRANLWVRGAGRVLARLASFKSTSLTDLQLQAGKVLWRDVLRSDVPFGVEATCRKSRIYHSGAAAERVARAIGEAVGASEQREAPVSIKVRIDHDICTLAVDTSGDLLHKRGHKEAVNAAPMRETMAALFLRRCGYTGDEPVLDPMCGSGTFVIEAAEIAARLNPGRSRHFAFEHLATFDAAAWERMRTAHGTRTPTVRFFGSDRDVGAVRMSEENALRAGVADFTVFRACAVSEITRPEGPAGLVIVNPPYGTRLGDARVLSALYRALGQTLAARFSGWRVGLITTDARLARATGLPFLPTEAPVPHGGLRVTLHRTDPLP